MGYKSTLRSINSAVRQMERAAIRRQKEIERQRKYYEKMQELEQAAFEVSEYENHIERMTTLQKDCGPEYDWEAVLSKSAPKEPKNEKRHETHAAQRLDRYKPNLFAKVFGLVEKKKKALTEKVDMARKKDDQEFAGALQEYESKLNEHNEIRELSKKILEGNVEFYKKAVEELSPFDEIHNLGSQIEIQFMSSSKVKVILGIHDEKVIPKKTKALLKSGKLSTKDTPKGQYHELYQDYVCSAALRIGRELFALLPIEDVIVSARGNILNSATGRLEEKPILSVLLVRETMETLNFLLIDPSDSMVNFKHNMSFKKTQGMSPVQDIE